MSHPARRAALLLLATGLVASHLALAATAAPTPSVPEAEQSEFDGANRSLAEQSMSRACEAFRTFLRKHPSSALASEAKVKGDRACLLSGKDSSGALQSLRAAAGEGPADLPRALAHLTLVERGETWMSRGNRDRTSVALEQLEAVARGSGGRWAQEARGLFFRTALNQMEQQTYNTKLVEGLCERMLSLEPSARDRAHALLVRARAWMQTGQKDRIARAEKDLLELGRGQTEYADDALFWLGQHQEGTSQYPAALSLYEQIVSRFNGTTSNVFDQARSRIEEIKRPRLSVGTQYIEQPGVKPTLNISFRNLTDVTLTLRRVDPLQQSPEKVMSSSPMGAPGEVVKRWTRKLTAPSPYAPSAVQETIEVPGAGAWIVEASSNKESASDWLLITTLAMEVKVSPKEVAVFVANAITGEAARNADIVVYTRSYDNQVRDTRLQGRTDEMGLVRLPLNIPGRLQSLTAWASAGGQLAFSNGWAHGYGSDEQREWLAYVLTDRPLYKPGETVGAKLFLRDRANGPSTPVAGKTVRVRAYDAQSREVLSKEFTTSPFGTAAFEIPLGKDAALGQWRFVVDASSGSYSSFQQANNVFRVEEFKPPEFLVSVEPVGSPSPGQAVKVRISASRYSGGPVANANGRAIVTEQGYVHRWSRWEDDIDVGWVDYSGYGGYSEEERYYGRGWQPTYRQTTLTFKTGPDGTTELELPKPADAGDRSYQVQVFVTDASRREVTGSGGINVSSTPVFVDVRSNRYLYKPGEPIQIKLRAEDANGRGQSPAVELRLVRLEKDGRQSVILKRSAQLTNGRGEAVLDGDAVGPTRIEVRRPGAPDTESPYAVTDVWLTNDAKPFVPPNMGFALLTDRAPLAVGGTVRALVITPTGGGHVLFTIEGQELHSAKVFPLSGRARFVELPLTAAMTPNAWLHVGRFEQGTFLQTQAVVKVSGTDNALQVNVSHGSEQVEPGAPQKARIEVKGAQGEVELMVSSVDEAIFAIASDRTDVLSFFGRRPQQLWVTTTFMQNQRSFRPIPRKDEELLPVAQAPADSPAKTPAPATAGSTRDADKDDDGAGMDFAREKKASNAAPAEEEASKAEAPAPSRMAAAKPGGGGPTEPPVKVRSNFSSSAGWFPQERTNRIKELALTVPDSLTRFRTLAVAMTQGEQMGLGKATFRTEKPLMVRLQSPRFFTERDEVTLSGLVSNRLGRPASVQVSFSAPGFEPLDATQRTVEVPAGGDTRVDARFRVVKPGDVTVQVVARGGGAQDAMELTLPVVIHGSAQRAAFAGRLSDSVELKVKLPEQRNASATRFELTVSPTLVSVMMDALPYLAQYPYGCVEQTLSRFVPATIAAKTARDLGLPKSRVPANLDDMVDAGLKRLYGFQHGDGGWGWWQTDSTNRWMTAYVVYGLALGRSAGLNVDPGVLERGRSYLTSHLGAALGNPEEHTWMLYALASTGSVPKAGLDKAFERRSKLSNRGRALLALALIAAKDPRARIAVENLDDILKAAQERQDVSAGDANDIWQTSEAIEATAYTLMAVYRYDPNSPWVKPLTDFLVLRRNGGKWRTTRDTAFSLYALSELAAREKAAARSGSFIVQVNGREAGRVRFSSGGMDLTAPVVLTDAAFRPGENTVVLQRDGAPVTGYYAATFDVYNRDENVKGVGGDVKVVRKYTLLGKPSAASERMSASAEYGMPVESGIRVRVDLEVKANKAVEFLMVEDLKPAGLEAVALRSGPEICNYQCAHVELRNDRVAFFLSQIPVGVTKLSYELRAEAPGRFHALPARLEAMYAPELRATSDEMRMEVRDAPDPGQQGVAKD
ncbi:alpha-2-macroglobulin family protein [Hyalangium versicolor]|uniref:alpha-2-macroglobulin family protein n=1 Tax=Hyalangium versicolor TaxID=2861190 RepID=UPI001CCCA704|nr:MG2 domain-containing protein [Hyalangium versicolor]